MDDAKQWYEKLISVDPKNKEAYYTFGVIAWTKTFAPRMEARAKLGMKPEDPGPIKDKKIREELTAKNGPIADEGIQNLQKALQIDPEYDDAMAYMNLLLREKADLEESPTAYKKDTDEADTWVQKSLETRKHQGRTKAHRRRHYCRNQVRNRVRAGVLSGPAAEAGYNRSSGPRATQSPTSPRRTCRIPSS